MPERGTNTRSPTFQTDRQLTLITALVPQVTAMTIPDVFCQKPAWVACLFVGTCPRKVISCSTTTSKLLHPSSTLCALHLCPHVEIYCDTSGRRSPRGQSSGLSTHQSVKLTNVSVSASAKMTEHTILSLPTRMIKRWCVFEMIK